MGSKIAIEEGIKLIRKVNGLPNWTDSEIEKEIKRSIMENTLSFSLDKDGQMDGIVFGKWTTKTSFHAQMIVGNLKLFVNHLKQNYPFCSSITGERKGKLVTYNFTKQKD